MNLTSVENEIFNFNLLSLNPSIFSESTTISFTSKSASNCILTIFDVSGLIIKNESIPVSNNGEYQFVWEAYDYNNNKVANGVYYISIQTNKEIIYGKVILNR